MSVNHVIASIRKETIDSASEKLKFDSTFLEISNNLLVNNDCSLNGGATISNEIIIDGIINVKISNYNFSQNSIEQKIYNPFFPCGSVVSFATKKAPDGWLECDGNAISRIIYANLFNIIGTTWGVGDNSTTFNLPNLNNSGSFIRGGNVDGIINHDTTRKPNKDFNIHVNGTLNNSGEHQHNLWYKGHEQDYYYFSPQGNWDGSHQSADKEYMRGVHGVGNHNHSINSTIYSSDISNWDNETAPKNIKFLYCIKY
jgi:hypothetical protein